MDSCPVCSASLGDHDETSANIHIERCLDGVGPSAGNAPSVSASQHEHVCPICNAKVPIGLEEHVQACLQAGKDGGGKDEESCPCCMLSWASMGTFDEQGRTLHVTECLAAQQAMVADDASSNDEDDLDVIDEHGNKLSSSQLKALLSRDGLSNGFGKLGQAIKGKGRQQDPETPNLIPILAEMLEKSFASSHAATRSAVLCTPTVSHVRGKWGDFGWGCGYRNAQIVFSALRHVDQYQSVGISGSTTPSSDDEGASNGKRKLLDQDIQVAQLPTIQELQEIAEKAWKRGFDPDGLKHFKGKLIGSKRWIGTSEVYTMFTWLGIRATVVDFPKSSGSRSTQQALTEWVFAHFQVALPGSDGRQTNAFDRLMTSKGSCIRIARDKMPLYLQHQGHSRTIVGVEVTKAQEVNLLLFDPGRAVPQELRSAAASAASQKRPKTLGGGVVQVDYKLLDHFRVNLRSLSRKDEYQILRIETEGGMLDADEKLQRRIIRSLRVT